MDPRAQCEHKHSGSAGAMYTWICLQPMYITPLSSIITYFGLKQHLYADDTQIYTCFVAEYITQSFILLYNIVCRHSGVN